MQHAKVLLSILTIIFINGCADKECKPLPIPQKCVVKYTPEPIVDNTKCAITDFTCKSVKAVKNYIAYKEYTEKLVANSEGCR